MNTSPCLLSGSGINWPSPPLNPLLTSRTRGFTAREHRAFEDEHLRERVARPARPRRALRRARRRRRGPRLDAHEPRRRRRESSVAARRPRGFGASRAENSRHPAKPAKIASSTAADARARQRGPRPRRGARRVSHDLRHRALPGPGVQAGGVQGPGRLLLLRRPPLRRHPGVPGVEARPAHALRPAPHRGHRRRLRVGGYRTAPGDPRPRARRRGRRHRRTRGIRARDELGTPGRQRSAGGRGSRGRGGPGPGGRQRPSRPSTRARRGRSSTTSGSRWPDPSPRPHVTVGQQRVGEHDARVGRPARKNATPIVSTQPATQRRFCHVSAAWTGTRNLRW